MVSMAATIEEGRPVRALKTHREAMGARRFAAHGTRSVRWRCLRIAGRRGARPSEGALAQRISKPQPSTTGGSSMRRSPLHADETQTQLELRREHVDPLVDQSSLLSRELQ